MPTKDTGPAKAVTTAAKMLERRMSCILKTAHPLVSIPACFLGGAIFCLGCDLIARTAFAPAEMSISSVTAIVGSPVVIMVLLRRKERS